MTDVSRFNEDNSGRPAPQDHAQLLALMGRLAGAPDHWDRPDGDFGPLSHNYHLDREARAQANSLFRLGSKALARDELSTAADWLGQAASAGHPGALFRLAVAALRAGEDWAQEATFLIAEAARHGHGDARRLLAGTARRPPDAGPVRVEDPTFFDEVRERLGVPEGALLPPAGVPAHLRDSEEGTAMGRPHLVLIPPPLLPDGGGPPLPLYVEPEDGGARPRLAALRGGLDTGIAQPLPGFTPDIVAAVAAAGAAPDSGGEEPCWSVNALRPAILNDIARNQPAPAASSPRTQAAQRARDLLQHICATDGVTTRTLAQRGRMSLAATAWLLHWLREQHLVETVAGVHFAGPVMKMATRPDQHGVLLEQTLAGLRDRIGAAVYLSTYTDGEVQVLTSAHSPAAPAVEEWVAFRDTAHASAVGKSLLAQLDFGSRMDHLARYPSIQLTERTITDPRALLDSLDGHGPHAAQFDLLEYSCREVCVAYSLGLPGRASCVALSLPVRQYPRLLDAARELSERTTGLLLAHLLTDDTPSPRPNSPTDQATWAPTDRARALP
ncbi:IclR family transcriptional regulator C-terminal domain-containing protein [Streptomyces sp. NPDC006530]|uniref:IclR family transcriptional regulator domain-containing protein n=1 Tax=Streptomyces sp. NPDC006530 TaxID=3364750 RepID=UPI0036C8FCAC